MSKRAKRPMTRRQIEALAGGNPRVEERLAEGMYEDRIIDRSPASEPWSWDDPAHLPEFGCLVLDWMALGQGDGIDWASVYASLNQHGPGLDLFKEAIICGVGNYRLTTGRDPAVGDLFRWLGWPDEKFGAMQVYRRMVAELLVSNRLGIYHADAGLKGHVPFLFLVAPGRAL